MTLSKSLPERSLSALAEVSKSSPTQENLLCPPSRPQAFSTGDLPMGELPSFPSGSSSSPEEMTPATSPEVPSSASMSSSVAVETSHSSLSKPASPPTEEDTERVYVFHPPKVQYLGEDGTTYFQGPPKGMKYKRIEMPSKAPTLVQIASGSPDLELCLEKVDALNTFIRKERAKSSSESSGEPQRKGKSKSTGESNEKDSSESTGQSRPSQTPERQVQRQGSAVSTSGASTADASMVGFFTAHASTDDVSTDDVSTAGAITDDVSTVDASTADASIDYVSIDYVSTDDASRNNAPPNGLLPAEQQPVGNGDQMIPEDEAEITRYDEAEVRYSVEARIFVGNLPTAVEKPQLEKELKIIFQRWGTCWVKVTADFRRLKNAFVQFTTIEHAASALYWVPRPTVRGRPLRIEIAQGGRAASVATTMSDQPPTQPNPPPTQQDTGL
ncbi:hypothetical protein BO71DRAFT_481119 [Aspergillus ellipticus CBS 707.79]|uniref:RRM domain-containing protein n=1 Tax=Aspergillus ellipticus CBS 707.79 TaxID=1448320 RepID=A0A319EZK0_9EURO|nr:hypothetical protein BO71DRAFT_481119 [Aspergillus ellipticus CBS 707.79]